MHTHTHARAHVHTGAGTDAVIRGQNAGDPKRARQTYGNGEGEGGKTQAREGEEVRSPYARPGTRPARRIYVYIYIYKYKIHKHITMAKYKQITKYGLWNLYRI